MTTTVSVFEVMRGCRNQREEEAALSIFDRMNALPLNFHAAEVAASFMRLFPGVFSTEKAVPDGMIAGIAAVNNCPLVTFNTKQFQRINDPRLRLVLIDQTAADWTAGIP